MDQIGERSVRLLEDGVIIIGILKIATCRQNMEEQQIGLQVPINTVDRQAKRFSFISK